MEELKKETTNINGLSWNLSALQEKGKISTLEKIKRIDKLPVVEQTIQFSCDYWDFGSNKAIEENTAFLKYDFSQIYSEYKDVVKGMVINYQIIYELAFSSTKQKFLKLKKIVDFLASKHIFDYELIDLNIIKEFYNNVCYEDVGEETKNNYMIAFKELLLFISTNYGINYGSIYKYLEKTYVIDRAKLNAERELGKFSNIPRNYFNKLVSCAMKEIINESLEEEKKIEACIVIMLSQTGIRIGELRLLEANKKYSINILEEEIPTQYLEFKSSKTIPGKTSKWVYTFLTDKASHAYECLEKLSKEKREATGLNNLFLSNRKSKRPLSITCLRNKIIRFIARNRKNIDCINSDYKNLASIKLKTIRSNKNINEKNLKNLEDLSDSDIIYYPAPHQFRVAVVNILDEQGIDLDWIKEHMNHLKEEMTEHYRRKKQKEERTQKEASKKIFKEVLTEDYRLIGQGSERLMKRIYEFVENNEYNVEKDLDELAEKLAGKVPIRKKSNGFCIKSAFGRRCTEANVNQDIYCAFGICPNHFVNFKMLDISYENYTELRKIIDYNKTNGFTNQAQMETNKLKKLIEEALIPELEELEYEINKKGKEEILNSNPHLSYFINNLYQLQQEVKKWV